MNASLYIKDSKNSKLGSRKKVDATYLPIQPTCPNSCSLKDNGCYAMLGYVGITVSRLEASYSGSTPLQMARFEAKAIDQSYNSGPIPAGRDMRLHVSGDSRTVTGSRIINKAVGRWKKRGGGDCWSYTHAWKQVPRSEWSNVSILASVSTTSEVEQARKQGYAPTIVVPEFKGDRAFTLPGSDTKWIPCPAQTKDKVGCTECRLCMRSDWLYETNRGIAFAAHGAKKGEIKRRLPVLNG